MMSELERRMGEVEVKQTSLESEQRRLRADMAEQIQPLIAKMEQFKATMQLNHEAVMSAWEDLTNRFSELLVDHKEFHKGNGVL